MNSTTPMPSSKWLLRIAVPLIVLGLAAALLITAGWRALRPATEVQAVTVVVRSVQTDEPMTALESEGGIIQAPGWVEAEPFSVYAGALAEGVVEQMLVLEGDHVTAGQAVAKLVSDDARIALAKAEADSLVAQQEARNTEAMLSTIDPELAAAHASQQSLIDEYTRKEALIEGGAVAKGPVARLAIAIDGANAVIDGLHAKREVLAAQAAIARANIAVAKSIVEEAALKLSRMTIVSPINGVIIERLTSPGSVIRFGNGEHSSHVVHLYDPAQLQVRADVPLSDAANVGVGHPAEIVVDVLPNRVFTGEVTRFVHRADIQKNTLEAKVRIHNPSELLKPDMLARVRILQPTALDGERITRTVPRIFLPQEAIQADGTVLIIDQYERGSGLAARRTVVLGPSIIDGWQEVVSGLNAGDRVILDATSDLDGTNVWLAEAEDN